MSFNVSQHVKDKETYGQTYGQSQPARAVTPYQTDQGINLSELARQAAEEEEEIRRQEEEARIEVREKNPEAYKNWLKAQAARNASQQRGETGEQWYNNAKTEYDTASKLLADLKKTKASNAEIEETAKRLAKAQKQLTYAGVFRYSDITSDKDYQSYINKGKSILSGTSDVAEEIKNGTYSPTGNKILDFFYRLVAPTASTGYGGSGSGQAMNAAVQAHRQDTNDQVIDNEKWTKDEKNTYLYLLGRDGEESARQYAIEINSGYSQEAQRAQQEKISEWSNKNAFNGAVGTAASIVGNALGAGIGDFANYAAELAGKGYISDKDYLTPTQISSVVQSSIAQSLNEKSGTINENVPVIGGKGLGDAYQIATSVVNSWVSIGAGGEVGSLMSFFGNAAAQGTADALNRGLAPEKAIALGFCNGLAEVIGEKFSVDNLIHINSSRTLGQFFKSVAAQAGIEGSEEGFTTLLNTLADNLINGDLSEYNQRVNSLMAQGMGYDEAKAQASKEWINDTAYDILSGAASGGISGVGGTFRQSLAYNGTDSQILMDTARQVGSDKEVLRAAEIERNVADSKSGKLTRGEASELYQIIEGNGGTEAYARATDTQTIRDVVKDLDLSKGETDLILDGYSTGTANATTYAFGVREAYQLGKQGQTLEQATQNAKFGADLNETQFRHAWQLGAGKQTTESNTADIQTPEGAERLSTALSMLGDHAQAAADVYDSSQDVSRFAAAMNKAANLYAANGTDVKALAQQVKESGGKDIISYLTEDQLAAAQKIGDQIRAQNQQQTQQAAARFAELRDQADVLIAADATSSQALNNINKAIAEANKFGKAQQAVLDQKLAALDAMVAAEPSAAETDEYKAAYAEAQEAADNIQQMQDTIAELEEKRKEVQGQQPVKRKKGTVSFDGGKEPNTGKELKAVDRSKLSKHQKNVVSMVEALADIINIDYVFFDGENDTGGEYIGDGVIYININSGVTRNFAQGIAAASLSHELTHFMQEYAPEEYAELRDFIVSEVMKKSLSEFDALVKQQLQWQPDLTYDQAVDEVVANACQNMLLNSSYITKFAREHMTAAERVADTIHDIVDKIKAAYEGIDFKSNQGPFRAVQAVIEQSELIQKRWDKGIEAAVRNYNAEQTVGNRQREGQTRAAAQRTGVQYQKTTPENDSIRIQLQGYQEAYPDRESVADIKVNNVPKTVGQAVSWAVERLKHTGFEVNRQNFGTIVFDEKHIREALRHIAGKTDEFGAIIALPRVLKRGEIIESHDKHQGRVQDSFTIAAPITVNGVKGDMAVVVHRTTRNFFHAYRVLLPDGSNFTFGEDNKKAASKRTGELPGSRALIAESVETASVDNVTENGTKVKRKLQKWDSLGHGISEQQQEYFKNSTIRDAEGHLKVMYRGGNGDFTVFDRGRSSYSNLFGRGFYFTESKEHAQQYGKARAFYLDIRNPLQQGTKTFTQNQIRAFLEAVAADEDYGLDNYGYGATVESVMNGLKGKDDYGVLMDINATCIGDLVAAAELFNSVNGTDIDGVVAPTETVAFRSEQIKLTDNRTPTRNPDIRYQMWDNSPTEDIGDNLIAVHNVTEEKLLPAIKLGGLPMPSIAIVKAKTGHTNYGPISLLFGTKTVDPKKNRKNKVYGADAWTPMRADVEREINGKRLDEIETRIKELADKTLDGLYSTYSPIRQRIGDDAYSGDMDNLVERFAPDPTFNAAYAADKGISIEPEYAEVTYGGPYGNESVKEYIALVGIDKLTELEDRLESGRWEVSDSEMQDIINSVEKGLLKGFNSRPSLARKRAENIANNSRWVKFINDAWAYHLNQGKKTTEIDKMRTAEKLTNTIYESGWDEYKAWIRNELEGLIGEQGIANGKDPYYPDGRRKSFWQTHDTYSLANVVKAMSRGNARGAGIHLGATHLQSITAKDYSNLSDVKKDSGRLRKTTEAEYSELVSQVDKHLSEMVDKIAAYNEDTSYFAKDVIGEMIIEAARGSHTVAGLQKTFKQESDFELSPELAQELAETYQEAADLPTEYFEAKPQRAVGFDEVAAAIIPDNSSQELKDSLKNIGVQTIEYEDGNEDQRLAAMQSVKDVQFQKWDSTDNDTQYEAEGRELAYARIQSENVLLKDMVDGLNKLTKKQGTTIAKLEQKLRLTKTPEVRQSDANRLASRLIKDNESKADKAQVAQELKALGDYILQTKEINQDTVKQLARNIASQIVNEAETAVDYGGELATYQNITADIKGKKLTIDTDFLGELDSVDGYDAFRKRNFANFTLAKRDTGESAGREGYTTVSGFYAGLQQDWGKAYFPDVSNEGEQIQIIADMFQRAKGTAVNPNEQYMGEATEELANQIAFEALDGVMRQTEPTQADKQKARTDALKEQIAALKKEGALDAKEADQLRQTIYDLSLALDKASSRYTTLRVEADVRAAQIRAEGAARAAEIKAAEQARANRKIQALKEHYQDVQKRAKERRDESASATKYRKQIDKKAKTLYEMLMKNSDKEHVPEVLKGPLAEFLTTIDFSSKRLLRGGDETRNDQKFAARLLQLQQLLANQQDFLNGTGEMKEDLGGYIDVGQDSLQFLRETAQEISAALGAGYEYTINQMSAEQLKNLSNFLSAISSAIKSMNSFMANERFAGVRESAAGDISQMGKYGNAPEKEHSGLRKLFKWENATPFYAFRRFGAGGVSIFDGLTKGWEKMALNVQEIINFTEKLYTTEEVNEWKSRTHNITLEDGSKITMTTAQVMELSMLLNREQARKHIEAGGIRIGDITTKKGKLSDINHYHLTMKDIANITSLLSARQLEVAKALQLYMSTRGAEWGNEISMRRFGYNFYTEGENYFPIKTDSNDRPMADTDAQQNSMFRLLNLSSSKSLNPRASNALVVGDIFETFADHMADQAKLNGLGLPILDAIKWFNYKERINNEDGTYDIISMQAAMEKAFGNEAQKYFRTLMKDINGVTENGDRGTEVWSKMTSNYKVAAVAANLRVALLQPTSYVRASFLINPKYLAAAFTRKNAYQEAMKYSGTAVWKSLGYYDTNIARNMRDQIQHNNTWKDNVVEKTMIGAELGDKLTWGRLWVACKLQTQAQNRNLTGEDLMQATADLFRQVVYSSQVMDSTLTRSSLMRSHSGLNKMLTPFMAEPTLSYNILLDAYSTYQLDVREHGKGNAWQRNGKTIGKAFAVYTCSAAFSALVESIWDAVRDSGDDAFIDKFLDALLGERREDDDEDDTLKDSFFKFLLGRKSLGGRKVMRGNLYQDISIFNKLPYLKNVMSLIFGYANSDMFTAGFSAIQQYYKIWSESVSLQMGYLDKPSELTYYGHMTPWGRIYKGLQGLSMLSGLPVAAGLRDVFAIWNLTAGSVNPDWKIKTYDANALSQAKKNAFNEHVKGTGLTEKQFSKILTAANADGNTSISQAELGEYLSGQLDSGDLSKEQVDAVWASQGWKDTHDFDWWVSQNNPEKAATAAPAATPAPPAKLEAAKAPETAKITTYEEFRKSVKLYSDDKETAYQIWESHVKPLGIDLDTYTKYLNSSDFNGNNSITQDELGETLANAIHRGELNDSQAEAIWYTLWNKNKSRTYSSWATKNGKRDAGDNSAWLELLELNEARGDYDSGPLEELSINRNGPVYHFEDYVQDYEEEERRHQEAWDAVDQAFMYFEEGNSEAPEVYEEAFADWYEHPDFEGQTFENYLAGYSNEMVPAARRTYSGVGKKAVRRDSLDYAFWQAVGMVNGRNI